MVSYLSSNRLNLALKLQVQNFNFLDSSYVQNNGISEREAAQRFWFPHQSCVSGTTIALEIAHSHCSRAAAVLLFQGNIQKAEARGRIPSWAET